MASSIRSRLFTHSVLLAVVPLLLMAVVVTWLSVTVHKRQALRLEREVAEQVAARTREMLQHIRALLVLGEKVTGVADLPAQRQHQVLLDLMLLENRPFDALTLLNLHGDVLDHVSWEIGPDHRHFAEALPWTQREAFLVPLRDGEPYFGPVFWTQDARPHTVLSVPLHETSTGSVAGVLTAVLELKNLRDMVQSISLGSGETVYLLDANGVLLAHTDPTLHQIPMRLQPPAGEGFRRDHAGAWVVAATARVALGNLELVVVAERRLSAALGLAYNTLGAIAALMVLSLLAALAVGYISIRRIVQPVQELAATARAVRNGVLSARAPTHGKDELGELAEAFNAMTEKLEQSLSGLQEKIGELTLTQERLKESEQQYRDIYEHASEGIFLVDGAGIIREANPQALLWLNMALPDLAGHPCSEILHPDDQGELPLERTIDIVREGHVLRMERRLRCSDGSYLTVDLSTKLIGENLVQIMFRDVTERKRMEEELVRAKNSAEEANKAKGVFLATMSHEIRTPLSNVIGMAELTLENDLDPELRENLELILDSAVSLIDIINDILDLAKIEARGISLAQVDFDLRRSLERTLRTFQTQAQRKNNTLHLEVAPDLPQTLRGDPGRLAQVLRNLVHNGIKFTENGSITLAVTRKSEQEQSLELLFVVRDTGIGVPQDKLNQLFYSFHQVDSSYHEKFKGTGLGLAISKKIVELMEGQIWVESEEGRGSTFNFTAVLQNAARPLDKSQANEAQNAAASRPAPQNAVKANILFAEDNAINQLFITDFLRSLGHHVTAVNNGKLALAALERQPFDLVLMDIQMPEMDGLEATKHIREAGPKAPFDPTLPILALTAYAMREDRQRFLAAGMDGCITKPVDRELLQRTIGELVTRHRQEKHKTGA